MNRRRFLAKTLKTAGAVSVGAVLLAACGDDDSGPGTPDAPLQSPDAQDLTPDAATTDAPIAADAMASDAAPVDAVICTVTDGQGPANSHGHVISIPVADINAPQDRMYTSSGGNHDHTVSVMAAELTALATNCTVTVNSNDTHPHSWVITMV